jgi:hypothetical protein
MRKEVAVSPRGVPAVDERYGQATAPGSRIKKSNLSWEWLFEQLRHELRDSERRQKLTQLALRKGERRLKQGRLC